MDLESIRDSTTAVVVTAAVVTAVLARFRIISWPFENVDIR